MLLKSTFGGPHCWEGSFVNKYIFRQLLLGPCQIHCNGLIPRWRSFKYQALFLTKEVSWASYKFFLISKSSAFCQSFFFNLDPKSSPRSLMSSSNQFWSRGFDLTWCLLWFQPLLWPPWLDLCRKIYANFVLRTLNVFLRFQCFNFCCIFATIVLFTDKNLVAILFHLI